MTQQTTPSGWHLRAGRERDHRWALIEGSVVTWLADRALATRFDAKAEALVQQMDIVAELGIQVAVVSDCPRAVQQDEAKAQHRASLERLAAEVGVGRCGPGPDRPRVHGV